jgi:hypothetical protein
MSYYRCENLTTSRRYKRTGHDILYAPNVQEQGENNDRHLICRDIFIVWFKKKEIKGDDARGKFPLNFEMEWCKILVYENTERIFKVITRKL